MNAREQSMFRTVILGSSLHSVQAPKVSILISEIFLTIEGCLMVLICLMVAFCLMVRSACAFKQKSRVAEQAEALINIGVRKLSLAFLSIANLCYIYMSLSMLNMGCRDSHEEGSLCRAYSEQSHGNWWSNLVSKHMKLNNFSKGRAYDVIIKVCDIGSRSFPTYIKVEIEIKNLAWEIATKCLSLTENALSQDQLFLYIHSNVLPSTVTKLYVHNIDHPCFK